jgi:hypothetical protein
LRVNRCAWTRSPRRSRVVATLAISLLFAAPTASQPARPTAAPAALVEHLRSEKLGIVTSVRGLPLGVRDALQSLFGSSSLDIAEPGAPFQVTDSIADPSLPSRRLVLGACSTDHCLVYYERGGIAHVWLLAVFHWTPDATRLEWGGVAPRDLKTVEDLRSAVLSGAVKGPNRFW